MFGWELPPFNSGGLGVACWHLAKALCEKNIEVVFVLPKKSEVRSQHFRVVFADSRLRVNEIDSPLSPYITSDEYDVWLSDDVRPHLYGTDLFREVLRYGKKARRIAQREQFDVIHAHDWLSFPAGIEAKAASGKPLVVHVHATEFDRTGGHNVNPFVYEVEKRGMEHADSVVAVSGRTRDVIVEKYGIPREKVEVVYNAVDWGATSGVPPHAIAGKAIVIFVGRITLQKGPDYFIAAAHKVLSVDRNILFVMAGNGDMYHRMVMRVAELGIAEHFLFTGFLRGEDLDKLYRSADLFVMPSVSEPFGLTALEALQHGTPVLISKQSGVGELLRHCLRVDFWDVDEMAAKILAVVRYRELKQCLSDYGREEAEKFSWGTSADRCRDVYRQLTTHN